MRRRVFIRYKTTVIRGQEIQGWSAETQGRVLKELLQTIEQQRPGELAEMFHQADTNKDGLLSQQEFRQMIRSAGGGRWHVKSAVDNTIESQQKTRPSAKQLRQLMVCTALPFVGFGFIDNFIMLTAGDWIEGGLGSTLHLSTLAAAALGNTVSDVAGLGLGGIIENVSSRFGLPPPQLSTDQYNLPITRISALVGSTTGITVGCILGMIPLVFI